MVGMLTVFLVLISGSVFASSVYKWRFEEALPLTCCSIVAVMYMAGLAGILSAGITIVTVLSLLMLLASVVNLARRKSFKDFSRCFFTPGFLLYGSMFAVLIVMHMGRVADDWDEFSHWMDIVKVMLMYNDFGTHPLAASAYQSYPPGMALFQYFVHETVVGSADGNLTEWLCFFAYHLYTFSFLFPFLKHLKLKQIGPAVFFVVGCCLIPLVLFPKFLESIYIDPFVGIVAGCGMAMLYLNNCDERKNSLYVFVAMFSLTLAKDAGMLFALFMAVAMLAVEGLKQGNPRRKIKRLLFVAAGTVLFLLIPKMLWELHLNLRNAEKAFSHPFDTGVLINVLIGRDDSYRKTVLLNFLRSLLENGRPMLNNSLYVTLPVMCLLLFTGMCWFHQETRRLDQEKANKTVILWILAIQTCVYVLGLCVAYMFKFPEHEAVELASFERYGSIALTALLMLLSLMAFSYLLHHTRSWVCLLMITVAFALIPGNDLLMFINRGAIHNAAEHQRPYKEMAEQTKDVIEQEESRIYFVAQGSNGFERWIMKFNLRPCLLNEEGWSLSANENPDERWTVTRSAQEWQNELKTYDYVLLYSVDDAFVQAYSMLFENPDLIQNRTLFRVDRQTGMLSACGEAVQ